MTIVFYLRCISYSNKIKSTNRASSAVSRRRPNARRRSSRARSRPNLRRTPPPNLRRRRTRARAPTAPIPPLKPIHDDASALLAELERAYPPPQPGADAAWAPPALADVNGDGRATLGEIAAFLVERVDTSILQTLACLIATMEKQHLQVTIIKPSAALIKAASLLGLSRHLGLAQQSDSNGEN